MGKFTVRFGSVDGCAEVEAVDRWDAVVQAREVLGCKDKTAHYWFGVASVQKLERKKRKTWWEKEKESEQQ